mmetsp:Transcript_106843/g.212156  ORF Transcript_106843/g.212156 Transcript_106843/m.212156 type:complete len:300 (-) Transcript_106843:104-1003(-)
MQEKTAQSGLAESAASLFSVLPTRHGPDNGRRYDLLALALGPFFTFGVVCLLFATVFHWAPGLVCIAVIASLIACIVHYQQHNAEIHGSPLRSQLPVQCGVAICLSTVTGLLAYEVYISQYWALSESHIYANVLPSEAAAGYADAGKLVFGDEAHVDVMHALGYKTGHVYCVAPIRDESMSSSVQYWAAGVNCCGARGSFTCDDAWDARARSALVIQSEDSHPEYALAVKQAEAAFGISSIQNPAFVRWVLDPEAVQLNFWRVGTSILLLAVLFDFMYSCTVAWLVNSSWREDHPWNKR